LGRRRRRPTEVEPPAPRRWRRGAQPPTPTGTTIGRCGISRLARKSRACLPPPPITPPRGSAAPPCIRRSDNCGVNPARAHRTAGHRCCSTRAPTSVWTSRGRSAAVPVAPGGGGCAGGGGKRWTMLRRIERARNGPKNSDRGLTISSDASKDLTEDEELLLDRHRRFSRGVNGPSFG